MRSLIDASGLAKATDYPLEIWVPYGEVESLVTLMQENLAETIDPKPEGHVEELAGPLAERLKGAQSVFICDVKPATLKVVKALATGSKEGKKFFAANPRKVEAAVSELKDSVEKLRPSAESGKLSPDLAEQSTKFAISTGEPDPLLGFLDAPMALAYLGLPGARRTAYKKRDGDGPQLLREGAPSYEAVRAELEPIHDVTFATVMTRGGEPYSAIEGDAAKQARASFLSPEVPPTKGLVVGPGGKGYDDTLSHAIRLCLGALKAVKKGGEVVMIAECRDGVGSEALQMYLTGRMTDSFVRKGSYVEGIEEISYVTELSEKYSVTLLSSLPELYAGGKLKFRTARGSGEALRKVFSSVGRTAKLNVVTRACETVFP